MLTQSWKLAPALATGNTVVMKPAEQTDFLRVAHRGAGRSTLSRRARESAARVWPNRSEPSRATWMRTKWHSPAPQLGRLIMEAAAKSNLKRYHPGAGWQDTLNIVFADADLV